MERDGAEYTIDELARVSGITTRNLRSYQMSGLLPPPERKGRLGYYNDDHLRRLHLIQRLQADGFSRASIAALLEAWDAGQSLGDVLGFEEELTSFVDPEPLPTATFEELVERWGAEPEAFEIALEIGLLIPTDTDGVYQVANPTLMSIGLDLKDADIPLPVTMEQARFLRQRCDEVADQFVGLFREAVWQPYVERGASPDELRHVTDQLRQLRPLISRSVQAALDESMGKAVARFVRDIDLPHLIETGAAAVDGDDEEADAIESATVLGEIG